MKTKLPPHLAHYYGLVNDGQGGRGADRKSSTPPWLRVFFAAALVIVLVGVFSGWVDFAGGDGFGYVQMAVVAGGILALVFGVLGISMRSKSTQARSMSGALMTFSLLMIVVIVLFAIAKFRGF